MSRNPLVSVIIPTYNRGGVVCSAIDGVLQQTYSNTEVIVVDDGSTDDTQEKLRKYGNRIRILTQENAGPAAARNRGIEIARGEMVAFQDSDDSWEPTKLERQADLLQRAGESVVCCLCNALVRFGDGTVKTSFRNASIEPAHEEGIWLNVAEILATRFVLFNQVVAIRHSALQRIGLFDGGLPYLEDYDLSLRLAREGPWAFIKEPLAAYRYGLPQSLSRRAHADAVGLKQCEVRILEGALGRAEGRGGDRNLRGHLRRELGWSRCGLLVARLGQRRAWGAGVVANGFKLVEHYRGAIFRRSPWFPRMETAAVERSRSFERRVTLATVA